MFTIILFRIVLVLWAAVALAPSAIAQAQTPMPLLLAHAHRLNRDSLPVSPDTYSFAQHFWLSRHAVLLVYKDPDYHVDVRRLDTRTGLLSRVHGLGPGLDGERWVWHGTLVPFALSPDHRWLIGTRDTVTAWTYEAIGMGNGRREVWPAGDDYSWDLHWGPGSRRWFTWGKGAWAIWAYRLGGPRPAVVSPTSLPKPPMEGPVQDTGEDVAELLGTDRRGRVLLRCDPNGFQRRTEPAYTETLYRFSLTPHPGARRLCSFRFPPAAVPDDAVLSPRADRLAWKCETSEHDGSGYSVWVSDLDGGRPRDIGNLPSDDGGLDFYSLQWTPDERHLSVLYRNDLWSIPVPAAPTQHQRSAARRRQEAQYLASRIHRLRPWGSRPVYPAQDWDAQIAVARLVQRTDPKIVEEALVLFSSQAWAHKSYMNCPAPVELSKVQLLMRIVFRLPEHDTNPNDSRLDGMQGLPPTDSVGPVNVDWPLSWRCGRPHLVSGCQPSYGILYDPVSDYRYLRAHFPLRHEISW
jgi:hypothetical protein